MLPATVNRLLRTLVPKDDLRGPGLATLARALRLRGVRVFTAENTLAAVVLALGVGASTPVLSYVVDVLGRPSPFRQSARLVYVEKRERSSGTTVPLSLQDIEALGAIVDPFEVVGAYQPAGEWVPDDRLTSAPARWCYLSPNVLSMLGVAPLVGANISLRTPSAVISYEFWTRHYGRDPGAVGKTLRMAWREYRVSAVMPRRFSFPIPPADVWVPLEPDSGTQSSMGHLFAVARLSGGRSREQAAAAAAAAFEAISVGNWRAAITGVEDALLDQRRRTLPALALGALATLFLSAAVVVYLMLAAELPRVRQVGVRLALGSSRSAVVLQTLTNGLAVSLAGWLIGLLLADSPFFFRGLLSVAGPLTSWTLDGGVIVSVLIVSTLVGCVASSSALSLTCRGDIATLLGPHGHGVPGRIARIRSVLAAGQVAAATFFLLLALLAAESTRQLGLVKVGVSLGGIGTARVAARGLLTHGRAGTRRAAEYFDRLLQATKRLPGVEGAAIASDLPVQAGAIRFPFAADGAPTGCRDVQIRIVSDDYFRVLGLRLEMGRTFQTPERVGVAVVNQTLARRCWPGQEPVGRVAGVPGDPRRIVGVVSDVRTLGLRRAIEPELYLPLSEMALPVMELVIKVAGKDASVPLAACARLVRSRDPDAVVLRSGTLESLIMSTELPLATRLQALTRVSSVAIVIALTGVIGMTSYETRRQRHELAIRLALGADERRQAFSRALSAIAAVSPGFLVGAGMAYSAAQLLEPVLFRVGRFDAVLYSIAGIALCAAVGAVSFGTAAKVVGDHLADVLHRD